ncbi:hypothetical protein Tco_1085808, partial [Tanacetum coccineum]
MFGKIELTLKVFIPPVFIPFIPVRLPSAVPFGKCPYELVCVKDGGCIDPSLVEPAIDSASADPNSTTDSASTGSKSTNSSDNFVNPKPSSANLLGSINAQGGANDDGATLFDEKQYLREAMLDSKWADVMDGEIETLKQPGKLLICQKTYRIKFSLELLSEFGMLACKPSKVLLYVSKTKKPLMEIDPRRSVICLDRWSRWHNLRQQRGQSVQEYTTEFRRLAVMLGISTTYEDVFTKSRRRKMLESTSRTFSKKWVKNDRGRHAVATTISSDVVELVQVEEVDKSLTLMVKPTPGVAKEKEELFTLKIQVKQELIEAIVDTGSEKNLISSSLVERLGLETTPHPRPYSLGWIKKDVDTQVNRQCKFRFAITNQFIDEVTCEVVPLDICQVIFGSPYIWERDAVYFRRAQKYEHEKDGKKYIVKKSNITEEDDLVKAFQARRM